MVVRSRDSFVYIEVMKRMEGSFGCEIWGFLCVHRSGEEEGIGFLWSDLVLRLLFFGVTKRMCVVFVSGSVVV